MHMGNGCSNSKIVENEDNKEQDKSGMMLKELSGHQSG
jgi:hypothetical protein